MKKNKPKKKRPTRKCPTPSVTALKFSPHAWSKLLFLRDIGETEVGGFGITSADEPLYVEDLSLVKQSCTWSHVSFDDESVADYFDDQVDQGRVPDQFARIWIHTHPGDCPLPSVTDEETFCRVFGESDWAIMFIIAREGQCYARLRFNVGPGGELDIPIDIDWGSAFHGSDFEAWNREYNACVHASGTVADSGEAFGTDLVESPFRHELDLDWCQSWFDYVDFDEPYYEERL